ncbi:hypothetical protein NPIL_673541 [Nephila pilipes]|uniref:Uncharacterized protein n=1 Tax=Nephila pilipes TaxID=299642 RepID=A0A8X6ITH6_NEPPI|nr:hypothetical protein NPIL_673541 [Nephila pilipes]
MILKVLTWCGGKQWGEHWQFFGRLDCVAPLKLISSSNLVVASRMKEFIRLGKKFRQIELPPIGCFVAIGKREKGNGRRDLDDTCERSTGGQAANSIFCRDR